MRGSTLRGLLALLLALLALTAAAASENKLSVDVSAGLVQASLRKGQSLVAQRQCVVSCSGAGKGGRLVTHSPLLAPGTKRRFWRPRSLFAPKTSRFTSISSDREVEVTLAPCERGLRAAWNQGASSIMV